MGGRISLVNCTDLGCLLMVTGIMRYPSGILLHISTKKSNLWSPTIHSFNYDVLCIIPGDVRNLSRVTRVSGFLTIFLVTYMLIFYAILAPS